jgi:hypothetical protein
MASLCATTNTIKAKIPISSSFFPWLRNIIISSKKGALR